MRALWWVIGLSAAATPALACDFHEGGFGRYGAYTGYEGGATYEEIQAREAQRLAERERAMEEARRSFLARFDIQTDDTTQLAAAATAPTSSPSNDADRSARPDAQDR